MNFINPIPSPGEYIWNSSISGEFSIGNGGPSNSPTGRQPIGYHGYESFTPLTADPPARPPPLGDDPRLTSDDDVAMIEGTNNEDGIRSPPKSQVPPTNSRRSKHGNLDWERHKDELRGLYLDDGRSLKYTMRVMKEKYSFPESAKWYKEQFKDWGWQKNLPGQHAQWMKEKANKRKRDDGKETVFFYGGLRWNKSDAERSATRSKKVRTESEVIVDTPAEIQYETPRDMALSPRNVASSGTSKKRNKGKQVARLPAVLEAVDARSDPEDDVEQAENILLSWNGLSRSNLIALFESARTTNQKGDHEKAEEMFLTALKGHQNVLGETHEETLKVAFASASFYVEQDRSAEADKIIEGVCRAHVSNFGIGDRRTQQVIMQITELLNGWNRPNDALAFLTRSKEIAEYDTDSDSSSIGRRRSVHGLGNISQRQGAPSGVGLMDLARDIIAEKSPARLEYGIVIARARVEAKDEAVETFLKAILHHCGNDPVALETQSLQARVELLRFYSKVKQSSKQSGEFLSAIDAADFSLSLIWLRRGIKDDLRNFEVMEALLGLTAFILKGGFDGEAERLFKSIELKAEDNFGWDEERTIWAKITIGIVYQTHRSWAHAAQWFSRALAASMAANGDEDGISRALHVAMEKRHFSYLSDEGRPFKTVFGVCGLTIRPSRLHLD